MDSRSIPADVPVAPRAWAGLAVVAGAAFVVSLDTMVLYVAFGDIRRDFPHVTAASLSWILSGYTIVIAAGMIGAGRWADRLGRRRVFLAGMALFTVASAICAAASGVGLLVAGRVLQGVGAAALTPASLALILQAFPTSRVPQAIALWGAAGALAAALGPTIGGLFVEAWGWRSVFVANLPIGIVTAIVGPRLLDESREAKGSPLADPVGTAAVTIAVVLLALGIVQSDEWGWRDLRTVGALAGGLALAGAFVVRCATVPNPVLALELFSERGFRWANLAQLLYGTGFTIMFFGNVQFLGDVWGYSPVRTGLAMAPGPLVVFLLAPRFGKLAGRIGPRAILIPGGLVYAAAAVMLLSRADAAPDYLGVWLPTVLWAGVGVAMIVPLLTSAAVAGLPSDRFATGSAVNAALRNLGQTLGVAIFVAFVGGAAPADLLAHHRLAWWLVAAAGIAVTATSWWLPTPAAGLVRSRAAVARPIPKLDIRTTIAVLAILPAVTLASCAVGPDYRPAPMAVSRFHNASAVEATSAAVPSPPLDRWWTGFGDPVLTTIVERALEQNLDLAAALARVDQARAAARRAGAALLPTADATGQVAKARLSLESPLGAIGRHLPGFDRNVTLYDIGVGASWEIDLFGGLRRGAEAARADAEAAEAAGVGVRITVAADAADAYFLVRSFQARLAFAREQVATDERLLELVRLRFAHDIASDREVAQAEALLAHARSTVPLLVTGLEAELNRLDVLMGDQPGTHAAELEREAAIPAIPTIPRSDEPVDVLRRRPDVIAAERRLAASNARIGAALGEYYPKLSIAGLLGFESVDVDHLFRSATFQPQGIAGLRWRLFDFGKIDAAVAEARGAEAEALARFRQSILRAAEDVENAFMALVQFEARTRELASEVAALERARDTAEAAYRGGVISLTDALDAHRLLLVSQDELAKTRADRARAAVASFRALGGGWSGSAGVAATAANGGFHASAS